MIRTLIVACSVCFGDPGSASSRGVVMAVLFLIGVVGTVLTGVAATIFVWANRARKLDPEEKFD